MLPLRACISTAVEQTFNGGMQRSEQHFAVRQLELSYFSKLDPENHLAASDFWHVCLNYTYWPDNSPYDGGIVYDF